ncbi:hypothetical protein R1sor_020235 [Riccia sorocarpa]|uniref:Late embryogenesis abundant protein LEA-2 subgroup domain-containing protein n=1 Tax=Riccia sorocarpa TaxID=122646 RepID=A0ABD3IEU6_9MARC
MNRNLSSLFPGPHFFKKATSSPDSPPTPSSRSPFSVTQVDCICKNNLQLFAFPLNRIRKQIQPVSRKGLKRKGKAELEGQLFLSTLRERDMESKTMQKSARREASAAPGGRQPRKSDGRGSESKVGMDPEAAGTEPFAVSTPMRESKPPKRSKKKICLWCCGITTGVIVLVVVILVILLFTLFKPKDPKLTVESVVLNGFSFDISNLLSPRVNVSLDTGVSVKNPNYASFKFRNTTAYIFYHGKPIGESSIPAGEIKSRGTAHLTVPVDVFITSSLLNANLTNDLAAGVFPVSTQVEIRGTANFLNIVKLKNARSISNCNVEIFLSNQTLKSVDCDNNLKV